MKVKTLKFIVTVAVMLVSVTAFATPFAGEPPVDMTTTSLFSTEIDVNRVGNNLQKRNVRVEKANYNHYNQKGQVRRAAIVNGADEVAAKTQMTLQNNAWNGYTSTGVAATQVQNVTFNRPMTIDAYEGRTSVKEAFVGMDDVEVGTMQNVSGFYGGGETGKEPGPLSDVVWAFVLCAIAYVVIRRR